MCIVCIAYNINRNVYMYLNTRIFPTSGYARVLLLMFIGRELGGTGTGCLLQFTYCVMSKGTFVTGLRYWFPLDNSFKVCRMSSSIWVTISTIVTEL